MLLLLGILLLPGMRMVILVLLEIRLELGGGCSFNLCRCWCCYTWFL